MFITNVSNTYEDYLLKFKILNTCYLDNFILPMNSWLNNLCNNNSTLCNEYDKVAYFARRRLWQACLNRRVRDWQLDHTRSSRYFLSQTLGKGYIPTSLSAQMTYCITA